MSERFDAVVPDTGEVVTFENGTPVLPGRATATSLDLPDGLSYDVWHGIGSVLQGVERSRLFWIGDWYVYGEEHFKEEAAHAVDDHGYAPESVRKAVRVSERIPPGRRLPELGWNHHEVAARMKVPEERFDLLAKARDDGLTVKELRAEVRRRKGLPDPAPRGSSKPEPEPEPEPIPGETRGQVAMLRDWLVTGSRLRATFKSGQVAALRSRECGVHHDPDRIDVLMEFLGVLHHTLTADREADEQAEGSTADLRRDHAKERANGSVGTRA